MVWLALIRLFVLSSSCAAFSLIFSIQLVGLFILHSVTYLVKYLLTIILFQTNFYLLTSELLPSLSSIADELRRIVGLLFWFVPLWSIMFVDKI